MLKTDSKNIIEKLQNKIKEILIERFPNSKYKQELLVRPGRLNFACPYCGDSATNEWKKRGNIYLKGYNYHCFNCGIHKPIEVFLKDFNKKIDLNDVLYLRKEYKKYLKIIEKPIFDNYFFLEKEKIEKFAIDKQEFLDVFGYKEIEKGSKIEKYLKEERLQINMNLFAWNEQKQRLAIFNFIPGDKKIIGVQARNFNKNTKVKYLTYKLDKLYEKIGKEIPKDDKDFKFVNSLSIIFNILNLNLNKSITVFEGPLDSFLFNNSIAVCSVTGKLPIKLDVRWFYDFDDAGRKQALNKIRNGEKVFLWKKFLKESKIDINKNKKIDLTDLLVYAKKNKINLPNFEKYFSNFKYDIYWI